MQISPSTDTGDVTEVEIVWLATKLRLDASGRVPHGYTVMKPSPSGSVTVMLSDTEPMRAPGRPAAQATLTRSSESDPYFFFTTEMAPCGDSARVSRSR